MMMTNPLFLLALLCCAVGCAASGDIEFGCMYDKVTWNRGAMPAKIVDPEIDQGKVKGATMSASTTKWEAIRFKVFAEDLNSRNQHCTAYGQVRPTFTAPSHTASCKAVDVLTHVKKEVLLNHIIPGAVKLHTDRLLVQRVAGKIIVPVYSVGLCGALTIPESHVKVGVSNVDMIMYLAAGPTGTPKAWAGACSFHPESNRPVIGMMNVGPAIIRNAKSGIRLAAHEIAHALGFDIDIMRSLNMVTTVENVRGWRRVVVSTETTVNKAKEHYNCENIVGMELENEGGSGSIHSHWEQRNARDELMTSFTSVGYYTALTLSVFDSMGYYRANWGTEEIMEWGRNKGCRFLEEKCVSNGTTNYPDMFCTDEASTRVCTFGRRGLGKCAFRKFRSLLPAAFQYFNDPTIGGASPFIDFCPIVVEHDDTSCKEGDLNYMPGSLVGPNSLCLKGEGLRMKDAAWSVVQDICAEISCEGNTVSVRYAGDDAWHKCPQGSKIEPKGSFIAGNIVCPSYAEVCGTRGGTAATSVRATVNNNVHKVTSTYTSLNKPAKSERTGTTQNMNSLTSTPETPTASDKFISESSTAPSATRDNGASDQNKESDQPAVSRQSFGDKNNGPTASRKNGASNPNLEPNTPTVSDKSLSESSTAPAVAGNSRPTDGNFEITTQPVAVVPIKNSSPEENDVKTSDGILSALPVINETKMVNLAKIKVDSSQIWNYWHWGFMYLCAFLIYVFALC